ncbi:AraC family transcriptional regulator [Microvirga sp. ACRRW]|uniref:helix-turn-helix transcriptional regulator n=1 Tax=Microvirga sp. ACRRW TaxID=2918205 RepID=UPI001EF4B50F|nr:AraC family transcriptional regulator [Microvirga sp. ACRRW]MCG7392849.1 AraC family transcriptional regulator [Microvirga sp. ACRRW]
MNLHQRPIDRQISRSELTALTEGENSGFRLVEPVELRDHEVAVTGDVHYLRFRSGLTMHCSNTLEVRNLTTQVVQEAGLSCFLFLQGDVEMRLGARSFRLGAFNDAHGAPSPNGIIVNCAKPDLLTRISEKGRHIRKLVITVPADWCETESPSRSVDDQALRRFCGTHLASASWKPSPRAVSLAEQILRSSNYNDILQRLMIESRSLEIAGEAFASLAAEAGLQQQALRTREYERIRAIAEQLSTGGSLPGSIEEIARDAGMSSSSLQRHFRAAYGVSVFEFIRNAKLDEARRLLMRDGVSVSEAAYRAGYSSAANFATAFKRRFGLSPKHVRG